MTFSIGSWFVLVVLILFFSFKILKINTKNIFKILAISFTSLLTTLIFVGKSNLIIFYLNYIYPKLNLETGKGGIESYMDSSIILNLLKNPKFFIFGFSPGGAGYFFNDGDIINKVHSPAYVFPLLITNIGIIGFILISFLFFKWYKFLNKNNNAHFADVILGMFVIVFFIGHYIGLYVALLVIGAAIGSQAGNNYFTNSKLILNENSS